MKPAGCHQWMGASTGQPHMRPPAHGSAEHGAGDRTHVARQRHAGTAVPATHAHVQQHRGHYVGVEPRYIAAPVPVRTRPHAYSYYPAIPIQLDARMFTAAQETNMPFHGPPLYGLYGCPVYMPVSMASTSTSPQRLEPVHAAPVSGVRNWSSPHNTGQHHTPSPGNLTVHTAKFPKDGSGRKTPRVAYNMLWQQALQPIQRNDTLLAKPMQRAASGEACVRAACKTLISPVLTCTEQDGDSDGCGDVEDKANAVDWNPGQATCRAALTLQGGSNAAACRSDDEPTYCPSPLSDADEAHTEHHVNEKRCDEETPSPMVERKAWGQARGGVATCLTLRHDPLQLTEGGGIMHRLAYTPSKKLERSTGLKSILPTSHAWASAVDVDCRLDEAATDDDDLEVLRLPSSIRLESPVQQAAGKQGSAAQSRGGMPVHWDLTDSVADQVARACRASIVCGGSPGELFALRESLRAKEACMSASQHLSALVQESQPWPEEAGGVNTAPAHVDVLDEVMDKAAEQAQVATLAHDRLATATVTTRAQQPAAAGMQKKQRDAPRLRRKPKVKSPQGAESVASTKVRTAPERVWWRVPNAAPVIARPDDCNSTVVIGTPEGVSFHTSYPRM